MSKTLWKVLRRQRKQRLEQDMESLISKRSGLGHLKQLQGRHMGTERIIGVRDRDDDLQRDPEHITTGFAQFYEGLYAETEGHSIQSSESSGAAA